MDIVAQRPQEYHESVSHPPDATHAVFNQPPPRTNINEFTENEVLAEMVRTVGGATDTSQLQQVGALVGKADFQHAARLANTHPPVLHTHDIYGHRVDEVEYHPAYHRILGDAVAAGAHTAAWKEPGPGASAHRAAVLMLFAQAEPGHTCPISMTNAAVEPLRAASPGIGCKWVPRLYSRSYDPRLSQIKDSALVGMAMTEKQGGSDIRASTTMARPSRYEHHLLTGHKWFCSAPMSDAFLVLAHECDSHDAGFRDLSCFLVPRVLPDDTRNVFRIQRLKDKLGNRANASSEVEFHNTIGYLVGEPGRGIRTIMGMVARTRLDCVLGTAAGMRQGVAEALWHARHRAAFGLMLVEQPAMAAVLADLALEYEAALATSLRLARAYDDGGTAERDFRRLATAVAKYWICKRGPNHAFEALECLGGNGYTESFPLAMRYREQPVLAIWEGTGNVIALDVLRAMATEPASVEAFMKEVLSASGTNPAFDNFTRGLIKLIREVQQSPSDHQRSARRLTEQLALALQGSLLIRYSPAAVSDAFIAARLGPERSLEYGNLPPSSDLKGILVRH